MGRVKTFYRFLIGWILCLVALSITTIVFNHSFVCGVTMIKKVRNATRHTERALYVECLPYLLRSVGGQDVIMAFAKSAARD